jgi:hypothetical protein
MNEVEKREREQPDEREGKDFTEGVDYYFEDGLMVLTRKFLFERGFCCESGCRNCPYGFRQPELK